MKRNNLIITLITTVFISAFCVANVAADSMSVPKPAHLPNQTGISRTVSTKARQEIIADEVIERVAKRADDFAEETPLATSSNTTVTDGSVVSESSEPALIEITSPEVNEIVYVDSYSICGVRDDVADPNDRITLFLARFGGAEGGSAEFINTGGSFGWFVGSNGVFTQSVQLSEGDNRFVIAACESSVLDAVYSGTRRAADILDSEIQVVRFTITYRSQNVAEKIGEVVKELSIANILNELEKK